VDKLPSLVPNSNKPTIEAEQIPLRMTGTDGAKFVPPTVPDLVQHRRVRLHETAPMYTEGKEVALNEDVLESLENAVKCTELPKAASPEISAPARIRTLDPLIKSQLLYQLSYRGFS
jgi:hypothetical protein